MLAKKLADRARLDQFIAAAASGSPPWLAKLIHQFAPAIAVLVTLINVLGPLYLKAAELAFFLYQTLPMDILYAMMGLAMCFCGGAYCASIAAVEAFALLGWSTTRAALEDIYDDVLLIKAAAAEDDKKDDDGDGTPDVQQLAPAALLQRKLRVFALAVRDPEKLSLAIGGLCAGGHISRVLGFAVLRGSTKPRGHVFAGTRAGSRCRARSASSSPRPSRSASPSPRCSTGPRCGTASLRWRTWCRPRTTSGCRP